jgi:hypothetical protein
METGQDHVKVFPFRERQAGFGSRGSLDPLSFFPKDAFKFRSV